MNRKDFFRQMYRYCDDVSTIEFRALPSKKRKFLPEDDTQQINYFCEQHQEDNIYFGVATRNGHDGTKKGIKQIPAVWCDIDYKDTPRKILVDRFKSFPFKPSIVVQSGGGCHFYWTLQNPCTKADIDLLEAVNHRIAQALAGDHNACDAARIMRVPDTVNHKYPARCKVGALEEFVYSLDDFIDILPEYREQKQRSEPPQMSDNWLQEAMVGCSKGNRNATGTQIAGYWINKASPSDVHTILTAWNMQNDPPLEPDEIASIVKSVTRYKEQDTSKISMDHVYDPQRMIDAYKRYVQTLKNNRFITGINEIDRRIRGVSGGEVLTIIARAGSFKTAMLQNMLKNYVQNSAWGAVFFSIEMPVSSVTERYLQMIVGLEGKEIEKLYMAHPDGDTQSETDFKRILNRLFVVPVKVSLSDIASYVKMIEAETNTKIGVVGIDYLGLVDAKGFNEYEAVSRIARGTKDSAKMLNIPVVLLSQTSRKGGGGETEISMDMGRGSGAIEEGADFVLGMWQEAAGDDMDLICRILKNRKGPKGSRWILNVEPQYLYFHGEATVYEPKDTQKRDF